MEKKKNSNFFLYLILFVALVGFVRVKESLEEKPNKDVKKNSSISFNAFVSSSGIKIEYLENLSRSDCETSLNSKFFDGGYKSTVSIMSPNETFVLPFNSFSDKENNIFNPYTKKISSVMLCCKLPNIACSTVKN